MGGGRGFESKALYFCEVGVAVLFFFQSSGQLAFMKMQVMVLLKKAVCSNGICWIEKKVPIFRRGLSRKKNEFIVVVLTDKLILSVVVLARS